MPEPRDPAGAFARWVDGDPDWELMMPARRGEVVFRLRPRDWTADDPRLDRLNERLREAVNASGEVLLSRAGVAGRVALTLAIGDGRTGLARVARAWAILRAEALRLGATPPILAGGGA